LGLTLNLIELLLLAVKQKTGAYELPSTRRKEVNMIYEDNFKLLKKLGVISSDGIPREYSKSKSPSFMDLVIERNTILDKINGKDCIGFSMAHYFLQNGDLCSDPLMEVLVYPDLKMVEAFSFDMSIPPLYQVVYDGESCDFRLKESLNDFLNQWLKNLGMQGFGEVWSEEN